MALSRVLFLSEIPSSRASSDRLKGFSLSLLASQPRKTTFEVSFFLEKVYIFRHSSARKKYWILKIYIFSKGDKRD